MLHAAAETLASQNLLVGLGVPDRMPEIHAGLEQTARQQNIPFVCVDPADIENRLGGWLETSRPDVVCVMGFPYKIPAHLLERPRLGFFNFHGGVLPRYRGPDPVFWHIRNGEPDGAITIHRVTQALDAGDVAHIESVSIGPEDTYGLYLQRLGAVLPRLMIEFVQRLVIHGEELPLTEQHSAEARYWKRPEEADLVIDWNSSMERIGALVRACNPRYAGALAAIRDIPVRLLQVSDGGPHDLSGMEAGTIIEASVENGIRVTCGAGQTLFLDIAYAEDGFFTGRQLVKLFKLREGERMRVPNPMNDGIRQEQ